MGRYTDIFPHLLRLGFIHPILSCTRLPSRLFGLGTVHVGESPIKVDNVGVFNLQASYQRHTFTIIENKDERLTAIFVDQLSSWRVNMFFSPKSSPGLFLSPETPEK